MRNLLVALSVITLAFAAYAADNTLEAYEGTSVYTGGGARQVDDTWIHYLTNTADAPSTGVAYPPQDLSVNYVANGENYELADFDTPDHQADLTQPFNVLEIAGWGDSVTGAVRYHLFGSDPAPPDFDPESDPAIWDATTNHSMGSGSWSIYDIVGTEGSSVAVDPATDCPDDWIALVAQYMTSYASYYIGLDQADYEKNMAMGFHSSNDVWQMFSAFGYSGDEYLVMSVEVGIEDVTDPTITDMYPLDADYPSGVPPTDSAAGCHWQDGDPDENVGIDVEESTFEIYLDGELILGMLDVDDTDLYDVIVDFEADDPWGEGLTYTVETETYDLAGNSASETWDFTTGYTNIVDSSFGAIKAGFAK